MRHVFIHFQNQERRFEVSDSEDWGVVAEYVLELVHPHDVITLSGPLGAGKTTFVQALAKQLGVEQHVQSPTFALMRSYPTHHPEIDRLLHVDAYRLHSEQELYALDLDEELVHGSPILVIEWPEKMEGWLHSTNRDCMQVQIFDSEFQNKNAIKGV
jgi:tRNA threonylcarbamoyladenosine biosynthesis protein TsaE